MTVEADDPGGVRLAAPALLSGTDRGLLAAAAILLCLGLLLPLAASADGSAAAFALAGKQAVAALVALAIFFTVAQASPLLVRRAAVVILGVALALLIVVAVAGAEVKGATRWLRFAGLSFQPTEILKPALVVFTAWMLAERLKAPGFPGLKVAAGAYLVAAALLMAQPDLGQTLLLGATLTLAAAAAGAPLAGLLAALVAGAALLAAGAFALPYVRARIDGFLNAEGYQVERAREAIASGGLLGRGPGEGQVKERLPDAHSDFIFAVAGEEFGLLLMALIIGLYAYAAWTSLRRAAVLVDPFAQIAATGLVALFALQAAVHIAVNLGLAPAKGITLPLVSYGGSSLVGSALTIGFLAALTRDRPGAFLYGRRPA